jgi:hypothetical protein
MQGDPKTPQCPNSKTIRTPFEIRSFWNLREALALDFKGSIFYGTNSVASQVYRGQLIEKNTRPLGQYFHSETTKKKEKLHSHFIDLFVVQIQIFTCSCKVLHLLKIQAATGCLDLNHVRCSIQCGMSMTDRTSCFDITPSLFRSQLKNFPAGDLAWPICEKFHTEIKIHHY